MRITKIGPNEVEVIRTRLMPSAASARGMESEVEVLDESTKVSYGRTKLESDINNIQTQINMWSDSRRVEEHIGKLREQLLELREIERVLNE